MSEWYLQAQGRTFPRGKSDYFLKKRGHSENLGKLRLTAEEAASLATTLICDQEKP